MSQLVIAVLPVNHMEEAEKFFALLDFQRLGDKAPAYRILVAPDGGELHLTQAVPGWVDASRNPFCLYFRRPDVDRLAQVFSARIIGNSAPSLKPWGMYEFAVNGPDSVLIRIGWPKPSPE